MRKLIICFSLLTLALAVIFVARHQVKGARSEPVFANAAILSSVRSRPAAQVSRRSLTFRC